jgi:Beta/Gamma crystallin
MTEKGGCYIEVWKGANFEGESVRIEGPAEFPSLRFAQGDWGDSIGSLRVGPNAFVIAYREENFGDRQVTFGPEDEAADLGGLKFDDDIESMRVIDSLRIFDHVGYNEGLAGAADDAPGQDKQKKRKGR